MAAYPVYDGKDWEMSDLPLDYMTKKQRRQSAENWRLNEILDHYAKTSVPFERIAMHCDMKVSDVEKAMKGRGRKS